MISNAWTALADKDKCHLPFSNISPSGGLKPGTLTAAKLVIPLVRISIPFYPVISVAFLIVCLTVVCQGEQHSTR